MSLMNRFSKGIVAAFEDENADPVVAEVEVGGDSAEAAVAETTEAGTEIVAGSGEIESAQADVDALDSIIDTVEASEAEGGLTPEAAAVVDVAVESLFQRLGVDKKPLVALESFSNKASRLKATHYAVEDWKATVKKVWAAIVNAFQKVVAWLKNFWASLFDAAAKLSNRATQLKVGVKAKAGQTAKESEMAAGGFVKKLTTSSGFDAGKAVAGISAAAQGLEFRENEMPTGFKEAVASKEAFDAFTLPAHSGTKLDKKAPDGFKWVGEGDVLGNKTASMLVPEGELKGEAAFKAMRMVKVEWTDTNSKLENKAEKVPTLSLDQISAVADGVVGVSKALNTKKTVVAALDGMLKNFINEANAIAKMSDAKDEGAGDRARIVAGGASAFTNSLVKSTTLDFNNTLTVAQAGLDYAEKSLKQYGEAKKEEAAAK